MKIVALVMLFVSGFLLGMFILCLLVSQSPIQGALGLAGLVMAVISLRVAWRFNELVNA